MFSLKNKMILIFYLNVLQLCGLLKSQFFTDFYHKNHQIELTVEEEKHLIKNKQ
jgi:hypothetical protein